MISELFIRYKIFLLIVIMSVLHNAVVHSAQPVSWNSAVGLWGKRSVDEMIPEVKRSYCERKLLFSTI